jgi:hypothetical protein
LFVPHDVKHRVFEIGQITLAIASKLKDDQGKTRAPVLDQGVAVVAADILPCGACFAKSIANLFTPRRKRQVC